MAQAGIVVVEPSNRRKTPKPLSDMEALVQAVEFILEHNQLPNLPTYVTSSFNFPLDIPPPEGGHTCSLQTQTVISLTEKVNDLQRELINLSNKFSNFVNNFATDLNKNDVINLTNVSKPSNKDSLMFHDSNNLENGNIKDYGIYIINSKKISNDKKEYNTFKVIVDKSHSSIVNDSSFWPRGIVHRPWFYPPRENFSLNKQVTNKQFPLPEFSDEVNKKENNKDDIITESSNVIQGRNWADESSPLEPLGMAT
ncbi:hypothetical protein HELRODRAFT_171580 [Helobdella robusta]|uniref:Uncharacterized protein n=1 Tax=Helobdella robusta TaxID=6412 RepID=T1F4F3_HELRO|nr:hypothetical protein HELRODRAFT_171580 [Helobdella robusta]ESO05227.1 hypothetical protein HELRODRAFT_171580 [Helobdella robusta]